MQQDPTLRQRAVGILDSSFERRTADVVRRFLDDIAECARAEIRVVWRQGVPFVRLRFTDPRLPEGCPMLNVQLVTERRNELVAPGRVIVGDELRRHVRDSVEAYFKINGISITRKAMGQ